MDVLTQDQWATAFAIYYERLGEPSGRSGNLVERGNALFAVWRHHHPMTVAAAQRRSDECGRRPNLYRRNVASEVGVAN